MIEIERGDTDGWIGGIPWPSNQHTLSEIFQIEALSLCNTITLDCIGHGDREGWSLKVCGEAGGLPLRRSDEMRQSPQLAFTLPRASPSIQLDLTK